MAAIGGLSAPARGTRSSASNLTRVYARLSSRFPPGTAETTLANALAGMGFRPSGSCDEDRTIRSVRFDKRGSGLVDVTAVAYWQADSQGKILWTKGFVAYTSL